MGMVSGFEVGAGVDAGAHAGAGAAGGVHPLVAVLDRVEAAFSEVGFDSGLGCSVGTGALTAAELEQVARRVWGVVQRLQGAVLLPVLGTVAERRLYRYEAYAAASSTRDLVTGWLRCDPAVAGRLLQLANRVVSGGFRATGEALAAGEIDTDHARAVVRSVRALPAGVMTEPEYRRAESTMLDTAKVTDPEVTAAAGERLLEVLAPDAAQEHADRRAERDRQRAEESRWFEVTGIGIAGCKELRLRAESETIDALMRIITGLTQPSTVDRAAADGAVGSWGHDPSDVRSDSDDPSERDDPSECDDPSDSDSETSSGSPDRGGGGTATGPDTEPDTAFAVAVGAERAARGAEAGVAPAVSVVGEGVRPPGLVAEGGLGPIPIERRRADAAVEVIDAIARPDPIDELTPAQLRWLAAQLETGPASTTLPDHTATTLATAAGHNDAASEADAGPTDAGSGDAWPTDAGPTDAGSGDAGSIDAGPGDAGLAGLVDAGQVATDTCGDEAADQESPTPPTSSATGAVPRQRSGRVRSRPRRSGSAVRETGAGTGGQLGAGRARVRGERPSLVVLVPFDTRDSRDRAVRSFLDDRGAVRGEAPGNGLGRDGGVLRSGEVSGTGAPRRLASATEVERHACGATITAVWLANGVEPVAVGAWSRYFRGKQLAALIARDRGCAFPGCSRGLRYAHAHHIVPWSRGGPTTVDNGVLLCSHHHRVVHRPGGWTVRMGADHLPEFLPPTWIDPERTPRRHHRHHTRIAIAA